MNIVDNNYLAFFALVRAGLWEQEVQLASYGRIDFDKVYRLAEEQSVMGLVVTGIEHVIDYPIPKAIRLKFVSYALQIEHRNNAMNIFIASLISDMHANGIYPLLVKGQGIAQCYNRPEWRVSGDIDLLLNSDDYLRSIDYLSFLSKVKKEEIQELLHQSFIVNNWVVELHGSLRGGLTKRIDKIIDEVQEKVFYYRDVRVWSVCNVDVYLPSPDNDLIFVFTHILQHFFKEGVGLRQICDWCRLLWTYLGKINISLLSARIQKMHLMTEWQVFASFAEHWLGMPAQAIPCYSPDRKWQSKADKVCYFVLETGSFGRNRDYSYYQNKAYIATKMISLKRHIKDFNRQIMVFPIDSFIIWSKIVFHSMGVVIRGQ